jgi:2'-hydroxyisoflavone reductase
VPTRREFLRKSLTVSSAAAAALAASRYGFAASNPDQESGSAKAARPFKLLILGGTGFLGPCVVRRAVERGHTITLFNRGRTDPQAFPELEKIKGDRNVEKDLRQLAGRDFDSVIDPSGYFPRQVRESAGLLAATTSHYVFVSSISVYQPLNEKNADENGPLLTLPGTVDAETLQTIGSNYGALKALCEAAAEKEMPGQVLNVRPGLIVGPDDDSDRFTYWPLRIADGGEVLAPGTPKDPVQFIDVRDLANFIVHAIENATVGVMNATGPQGGMPILEMLEACKAACKSDARFTFAPDDFLAAQRIRGWSDLPVWTSPRDPDGGVPVSVARAIAAGLQFRPTVETARDTLDWFRKTQGKRALRGGLARDAEQRALAALHALAAPSGTKQQ